MEKIRIMKWKKNNGSGVHRPTRTNAHHLLPQVPERARGGSHDRGLFPFFASRGRVPELAKIP